MKRIKLSTMRLFVAAFLPGLANFAQAQDDQSTNNVVRNYPSFSALTNEVARSRVFGGVHFPFDIAAGQSAGCSVANLSF